MAKVKKFLKPKPWFENKNLSLRSRTLLLAKARNKIAEARKVLKPRSARFARLTKKFGSLGIVILFVLTALVSFFLPKDQFQILKEKLVKNPNEPETHLQLTEKFLADNRFKEAERELLLVKQIKNLANNPKVLGEKTTVKLEELWQQKHYSDPEDIKKLIAAWEKIVAEKPGYRDGYLQLAYLNYKIFENEKAKEYLGKAIELDPNYEPARELEKIL